MHCAACGDGGSSICARASPVDPLTHVRKPPLARNGGLSDSVQRIAAAYHQDWIFFN
jgi:hypothetical protein